MHSKIPTHCNTLTRQRHQEDASNAAQRKSQSESPLCQTLLSWSKIISAKRSFFGEAAYFFSSCFVCQNLAPVVNRLLDHINQSHQNFDNKNQFFSLSFFSILLQFLRSVSFRIFYASNFAFNLLSFCLLLLCINSQRLNFISTFFLLKLNYVIAIRALSNRVLRDSPNMDTSYFM